MPFIAIHWSFSLYFGWQTYFWKQGLVEQSQYYSPFTQVECRSVSSPWLFLQQLQCLSFSLLTPLPLLPIPPQYHCKNVFSLCHGTQLLFFTHKALDKSIQTHLLVLSPLSPILFFLLCLVPGHRVLFTLIRCWFAHRLQTDCFHGGQKI